MGPNREALISSLGEAASALVGCPFRLHGRDPATGLDCIGLVHASLAAIGHRPVAPHGYGLRNIQIDQWLDCAGGSGLEPASGPIRPDEVLLVALGYGQHHLMITSARDIIVHAHAGLRRVVAQPLRSDIQVSARWRIGATKEG